MSKRRKWLLVAFWAISLLPWLIQFFPRSLFMKRPTVYDGNAYPPAERYRTEFAKALKWTGGGHSLPHQSEDMDSPDRLKKLIWDWGNGVSETTVKWKETGRVDSCVAIRDADFGSGRAHGAAWSSDSKAVFVYGPGILPGEEKVIEVSLVYLIEERKLYSVDLRKHLDALIPVQTTPQSQ